MKSIATLTEPQRSKRDGTMSGVCANSSANNQTMSSNETREVRVRRSRGTSARYVSRRPKQSSVMGGLRLGRC